jgi:tRNA uridine 5-carbamoylmethylation protein Kti12
VWLHAFIANVRLVYLEAPADVVFERNSKRDSTLSDKDLERMLHRWEVPLPWEAREVEYAVAG